MADIKKTTLHVAGMHCPSCDILIADKVSELDNVKSVKANYRTRKAEVHYVGSLGPKEIHRVNANLSRFGYRILSHGEHEQAEFKETLPKRLADFGGIALIVFILFYFAQELQLIPSFPSGSTLTLTTVFALGLVASTSTCMATSGALFLATVGKLNGGGVRNNLWPAISFNLGRMVSYGFFGFVAGILGRTIAYNFQLSSLLTLVVSFFMVIIGLDMARIISLQSIFTQTFTKGIFVRLERRLISNPRRTSFLLGALTYLLPCGFTQTVQLYALGLADPIKSAAVMMIFALGTMPALMAIGVASSFTKSSFFPVFQKIMGTIVFLIGIYYFNNFLGLYGMNILPFSVAGAADSVRNVVLKDNVQIAKMKVVSSGYYPNVFTVKKGVPVRWEIEGENVFGCQGFFVVPKLGITKLLSQGQNVIEFTPAETGQIGFSCGMGMYRGLINIIEG